MSRGTGLLSTPTSDQQSAIKSVLRAHGYGTGAANVSLAFLKIIAYCNIYGGVSSSNANEPIGSIPGLD